VDSSQVVTDQLIRGKKAERVALMDGPWPETVLAWVAGGGYQLRTVYREVDEHYWRPDDGRLEDVEVAGWFEEPVPLWQQFGYDLAGVGGWFDWHPIRDCDELVEDKGDWEIRRNGSGASLKFWKHRSGTPEHIDFRMTTREIWEQDYRPHLETWDVRRFGNLNETRKALAEARAAQKWTHYGHQFIWENMRQSMGDMTLYTSLLTDPDWIRDYCRVYTDFYKRYLGYLIEEVGKPDGVWLYEDLGYKNGLFASPKVLAELIFPYYSELVAFIHSYDLPVILHSCGSVAQAVPMIIEAGFDALNPMERKAKGNDPFVFAEKYGDKLAFVGGLDVRFFETNDREIIRREIAGYMEGMKERGARLVFASDHSIPPTVSYDTYQFILEVYREHMMY
jgi:uroporphyrinogen decarboxylase